MTIKFLATIAMAATLFSACGDSSSTSAPSKAEQCATGLSADCLMGTWSINGPTIPIFVGNDIVYDIDPSHNFKASPATLRFYYDKQTKRNTFEFINSPLSTAECQPSSEQMYGTWEIVGSSLHLFARIGNECMEKNDATLTPVIAVSGSSVTMTLSPIFFMENELKKSDLRERQSASEIYTFIKGN